MTDSFVTQCPHCRTSFRVSRAQLGAAHGAVRCGACLHVFNAAQHLLGEAPAPQPSAPLAVSNSPRPAAAGATPPSAKPEPRPAASSAPAQATPPGKQPSNTLWIHDDLDLDSIDLDEALAKLEEQEQQLSQEFLALERAPLPAESLLRSPAPNKAYDEEWTERLLNTDSSGLHAERKEPRLARPEQPSPPVPATTPTAATPDSPPPATAQTAVAAPLAASRREPSLTLDEPVATEDPATEHLHAERDDAPSFGATAVAEDLDTNADADEIEEIEEIEEIDDAQYRSKRSEPSLRNENLLHLEQEPLQLDWQKTKKPWGRKVGWLALNLLGLLVLGGQYTNYHFDELARQDQYRPWFEQLCPSLGCKLPSKVEISLVKSSNLVVRSHPEFAGALVVDAILYNRAPFSQPFPLLELRFADLNGQLLASRRFKPSEYLSGELAGQAEMPPQTPIHISLDILDPGTKAVNYSLSFHSPE